MEQIKEELIKLRIENKLRFIPNITEVEKDNIIINNKKYINFTY